MSAVATPEVTVPAPEPVWWSVALGELGVREVAGDKDNPRILEYLRTTTLPESMIDDETAWCSAFANWCMVRSGLTGTRRANARSWLQWGESLLEPRLGCVTVFWRGAPTAATGHVAFYVGRDARSIYVLGGNQSNAVNVAAYPKARLLSYRWPAAPKA